MVRRQDISRRMGLAFLAQFPVPDPAGGMLQIFALVQGIRQFLLGIEYPNGKSLCLCPAFHQLLLLFRIASAKPIMHVQKAKGKSAIMHQSGQGHAVHTAAAGHDRAHIRPYAQPLRCFCKTIGQHASKLGVQIGVLCFWLDPATQ